MGEYMAAEIRIGGRLQQTDVAALCRVIADSGVSTMLDPGASFRPRSVVDLLDNRQQIGRHWWLCLGDDQACWGEFHDLEAFLVDHQIPFDRFSEGKWEYEPTWTAYRLGQPVRTVITNPHREPVITVTGLRTVSRRLSLIAQGTKPNLATLTRQLKSLDRQLSRLLPAPIPPLPSLVVAK